MGNIFTCLNVDSYITDAIDHDKSSILCTNPELILLPGDILKNNNGVLFRGELDSRLVAVNRINVLKWKEVEKEIQILKELSDENVLRFIFKCKKAEIFYVVTEYYEKTLVDYVGLFTDFKDIFVQLINAVNYLQNLQILHLNIAPENIAVVDSNQKKIVKLMNFNYAVKIEDLSVNISGSDLHNKEFAAPEIYSSKTGFLTSDIFSMGCVFFYLFSNGSKILDLNPRNFENIIAASHATLTSNDILCADLIRKTAVNKHRQRLSIKEVMEHPITWDYEKTVNFIIEVYRNIETVDKKFRILLYKNSELVIGKNEDWTTRIDEVVLEDLKTSLGKYRLTFGTGGKIKDKRNIVGLIQVLRNINVHAPSPLIAQFMGTPEKFIKYWVTKFPGLLLHLYNAKCKFNKK